MDYGVNEKLFVGKVIGVLRVNDGVYGVSDEVCRGEFCGVSVSDGDL